jgi:hypothetical protein
MKFPGAALLVLALAWPRIVPAEGALALGIPPDVSSSGAAIGLSINKADGRMAMDSAMQECTGNKLPRQVVALCKPVRSFHRECVAIAMDPQAGTPGFGWAIGASTAVAERQALDACVATDGDRGSSCKVTVSKCDLRDEARLPERGEAPAADAPKPAPDAAVTPKP